VSTGACVGHVSPEALEGGPIGKLVEGDVVRVVVDPRRLQAAVDLVGHGDAEWSPDDAVRVLAERPVREDVVPDPRLPADTALWARLQSASGGLWGGCVYDPDLIAAALDVRAPALTD
jgi:dihydroxyacid dehydratase/phosphogluconate dehydratase